MASVQADTKIELLRGVPLFGSCSSMDMDRLAQVVDEVDVPDGYVIAHEGGSERQLAIIVGGTVRLERGGEILLRIGEGEYIGEMALLDSAPRSTTAVAEGPVKLLVMTNQSFSALVGEAADVRASVFETLARRIRARELNATD
jgi:CRP-like cAMP-binding protein